MGRSRLNAVGVLGLFLILASCGSWGTEDQAKRIFLEHRAIFEAMYAEIHSQPAIARVDDAYDPYDDKSVRFLTTFGPFTEETKRIYKQILAQMSEAQVETVVVARNRRGDGVDVEVVDFGIFGRGLGSGTESISIFAVHSSRPGKIDPHCRAIDSPVWLVCHWK